mgnify:CR=1 FL=1
MLLCALYTPMNKIKQQMNNNHNSGLYQVLQRDKSNRETKPLVGLSASHAVSEGHCRCAEAPLGNNAKSSDTFFAKNRESKGLQPDLADTLEVIDDDTGEVKSFKCFKWGKIEQQSPEQVLTERFALQSAVRHLMPTSRTAKCTRLTTGAEIAMHKSKEHGSCSYSGLQTCGSVWSCPVCAAKITTRRRNEVRTAMEQHLEQGGQLYFITYTFPHTNSQSLNELNGLFSEALRVFRASYEYKKFKKMVGYDGLIRALEVTFGFANGWHPHTHEVVFASRKVSFRNIKNTLFKAWKNACVKAGLPAPSYRRGLDVKGGDKAAEYVTKYGNELTMAHVKKARGDRFTPFDLLRNYMHENDKQVGAKFVEFAEAMKGKRQLFWTKGLKSRFGIDDMDDEQLAAKIEDDTLMLGKIPFDKWRAVIRYNARATLLILGQKHGFEKVEQVIDDLYMTYCTSGDKEKDDEKKRKYIEKKNRTNPHYRSTSDVTLAEKFNQVREALNRSEYIKKQDAERRTHIEKSTMQWYFENMGDIDNPFNC